MAEVKLKQTRADGVNGQCLEFTAAQSSPCGNVVVSALESSVKVCVRAGRAP